MDKENSKVLRDIHVFLAHAIRLEADAAAGFEDLAEAMATLGNREVEQFFRTMAAYSRKHLAEATARAGFRHPPELAPEEWEWPGGSSPELAGWTGVDGMMGVDAALDLALQSECRGRDFYALVAEQTENEKIRALAAEFAAEEEDHVNQLENWLERLEG